MFEGHVARVEFDALGADWRREIIRIYAALEIEQLPAALAEIEREYERSNTGAHREHRSQIARFAEA